MTFLDGFYRLAHRVNHLTNEEEISFFNYTSNLVLNRQEFNEEVFAAELPVIAQKIECAGVMDELKTLLSRPIDLDDTDLDKGVAGVH